MALQTIFFHHLFQGCKLHVNESLHSFIDLGDTDFGYCVYLIFSNSKEKYILTFSFLSPPICALCALSVMLNVSAAVCNENFGMR